MALSTFRFLSFTLSLALDTPIISQTHNHDHLNWRSDGEVMVIYEGWPIKHQKVHDGLEEKDARFQDFKYNLKLIDEHNTQNHTYKLVLNRFADLSNGEYRAMYLGTKTDNDKRRRVMKAKNTASPCGLEDESKQYYFTRNQSYQLKEKGMKWLPKRSLLFQHIERVGIHH